MVELIRVLSVACICFIVLLVLLGRILYMLNKLKDKQSTGIEWLRKSYDKFDSNEIFYALVDIRTDIRNYIKKNPKPEHEPEDVSDAILVEPCPKCGDIPTVYLHRETELYCIHCKNTTKNIYESRCDCNLCVFGEDKIATIKTWNDLARRYNNETSACD